MEARTTLHHLYMNDALCRDDEKHQKKKIGVFTTK